MTEPEADDLSPGERAALAAFAAPPPRPGFADSLIQERERRAARRRALAAALVAALLLVAGRLLWPGARSGEVVATARTAVDLGGRARAVAEPGAALRYRVARDGQGRVEQERGAVTYHVRPGGPFTISTRAGEVLVVGTSFQVELMTMKKPLAVAAVTTLALVVYEGRVLLRNRHGQVAVAAGERARAAEGAAPTLEPARPPGAAERRVATVDRAERERLLREIAAARSARRDEAPPARRDPPAGTPRAAMSGPGHLDKEYVRQQMREIIPLIQECFTSALEQTPGAEGRIVLRFTISGEPDIGGLVESAEVEEASEGLKDPSLQECMRESMYALRFKPPQGGGEVVVSYPFVLKSDGPPDGGEAPAGGKP